MKTEISSGKKLLFSGRDLRGLIVPLIIEQFLAIFVGLADSVMVASVGEAAVSAVSLIDTIMILLINIFTALATGGAIVAAQCVGAGDYEQARYYTRKLLLYSYVSMVVMNLLILVMMPTAIRVYNLSPETGAMARRIILYHVVMSTLIWPASFTLPNVLRAANDVGFCMWVSILSMWTFRVGFSYVLGQFAGMGVLGVWVAMTIDWAVRVVFFVWRYRGTKWQLKEV